MLLLAKDNCVGHLVLTQAFNQRVDREVAVQLVVTSPNVFEAVKNLVKLHGRKDLADVIHSVVNICLRLEGSCSCYVAHQARQLSSKHQTNVSALVVERARKRYALSKQLFGVLANDVALAFTDQPI